jgi:hypothetical protein
MSLGTFAFLSSYSIFEYLRKLIVYRHHLVVIEFKVGSFVGRVNRGVDGVSQETFCGLCQTFIFCIIAPEGFIRFIRRRRLAVAIMSSLRRIILNNERIFIIINYKVRRVPMFQLL